MPAPTPIRIQYGDAGLLGQAAADSGRMEGYRREEETYKHQQILDANFMSRELDRRQQAKQFALQQQMQYAQMAQTARMRGSSTPQVSGGYTSPIAQGVRESAAQPSMGVFGERPTGSATMTTGDEQFRLGPSGTIEGTRAGEAIPEAEIQSRAGYSIARPQASGMTPMASAKTAYFQSFADKLSPEEQQALSVLARDENVNLVQARIATQAALSRASAGEPSQTSTRALKVQGVDAKIRDLQAEKRIIDKQIRDSGYDPGGPSTQYTEIVDDTKWYRPDNYLGYGERTVTDESAMSLQQQAGRLDQQIKDLQGERSGLLQGESDPSGPLGEMSDEDILRQLIGG